ncbi:hypothetical protein K439DRAFT_1525643 [Ramaria rubella]|nr:hypothetical protein K439DRAFT_1525643 [Ramaria rubella]
MPIQQNHVLASQADAHFDTRCYIQSVQCYAQPSESFEEATLLLMSKSEKHYNAT